MSSNMVGADEAASLGHVVDKEANSSLDGTSGDDCGHILSSMMVSFVMKDEGETSNCSDGDGSKKSAWNIPTNWIAGSVLDSGTSSWPSLSESTKPSAKSFSSAGSSLVPLDTSVASSKAVDVLVSSSLSLLSPSEIHVTGSANKYSSQDHTEPVSRRSIGREGGASSLTNDGASRSSSPRGSVVERSESSVSANSSSCRVMVDAGRDRDRALNSTIGEATHNNSGHSSLQRNSHRRGNGRPSHFRAVSSTYNIQPLFPPPWGFRPPLPAPPPVVYASPFHGPFHGPFPGYGLPQGPPIFYQPIPPMFFSPEFQQLRQKIIDQIHYYFSVDNLVTDDYLRKHMDNHGWVPISLIAGFKRIKALTGDIPFILYCMSSSTVVQVQGHKIRKHDGWEKWILPPALRVGFDNTEAASLNIRPHTTDALVSGGI